MAFFQPYQATQDQHRPCGATEVRCINRVACGAKLFRSTSALLVVWSGLLCQPSAWPTVHATWLAVSTDIINPPTPLICGIHDIAGSVQNISQNQPVHPVAM